MIRHDDHSKASLPLLNAGEAHLLSRLEEGVAGLRLSELDSLDKTIAARPEVPESFRRAVEESAATAPRSGGFLGSVRGLLGLAPKPTSEGRRAPHTPERGSGNSQ